MKANQVMEILQISRSTLKRYREKGFIKAVHIPTGTCEFYDDSVR
ncbi:resolvase, partial [Lactobacillus johnsonii]